MVVAKAICPDIAKWVAMPTAVLKSYNDVTGAYNPHYLLV